MQQNDVVRFRTKVDTSGGEDACHPWLGSIRTVNGLPYGGFWLDGHTMLAHRVAWEIENGPIPPGAQMRHTCDKPQCVNTRHLLLGTARDNALDREAHGKGTRHGVDHHNARLDKDTVELIRGLRLMRWSWAQIAERIGVSRTTAQRAGMGITWTHLGPAPEMPAMVAGRRGRRRT